MGWLFVCFDLPVKEDDQRRQATAFRKFLLDDGFQMLQYSVYVRPCVSFARQHTHIQRIKAAIPPEGEVRVFFVTTDNPPKRPNPKPFPNNFSSGNEGMKLRSLEMLGGLVFLKELRPRPYFFTSKHIHPKNMLSYSYGTPPLRSLTTYPPTDHHPSAGPTPPWRPLKIILRPPIPPQSCDKNLT